MQEPKKCPKCGNILERGTLSYWINLQKKNDIVGDRIIPLYCNNCGYIEFYNQKYLGT
jgi:predicted nucleic-acid-binding Zn-ribbon protein